MLVEFLSGWNDKGVGDKCHLDESTAHRLMLSGIVSIYDGTLKFSELEQDEKTKDSIWQLFRKRKVS